MSTGFTSRRRAEQFQALLDDPTSAAPADLAALAVLAGGLSERVADAPGATPRAEFSASLRERLMAEAPAALATAAAAATSDAARLTVTRRAPSGARRERRVVAAIAAFSVVGATAATAVASQGTLPGDTLYPVKRLIEDVHTSMAMGDRAKADTLVAQANDRLDEARRLGARGDDADTGAIRDSLTDFDSDAGRVSDLLLGSYAEHHDAGSVDDLRTFAQHGITTIDALTTVLPTSVDGTLAGAAQTLITIDHAAAEACPTCSTSGITELPSSIVQLLGSVGTSVTGAAPSVAAPPPSGATPPKPAPSVPAPSAGASPNAGAQAGGQAGGQSGGQPGPSSLPTPGSLPTSLGDAVGSAGNAVGDAVGGVGGAVGGAGSAIPGPVGSAVGGLGDAVGSAGTAVGGTVGGVGTTVDGLVGGLLGGLTGSGTPTPKP